MADIERVIAKVFGNNTGSGSSGSSAKRQRLQQEGDQVTSRKLRATCQVR